MSEPTFSQPERRSFLLPGLLAVAALVLAGVIAIHFYPATTINIEHVHTDVLPTQTVFKSNSIVLGSDRTEGVLFVATTLKIDNQLRVPIFLDDFSLDLTSADDKHLISRALQKNEIPNAELSFPALKPLVPTPLLRETSLDPGKAATGTIVYSLRVPKELWDARKSAVVRVDVYHQPSLYLTIPKA